MSAQRPVSPPARLMSLQDDEEYKTVVFSDHSSQVYPNNSEPDGEVLVIKF